MNAKTIATTVVFAALTVALNQSPFKIPAPYAPFLYYQIWEIPIVAAFLLYGPTIGVTISIINTLVLLALFPGALPTGPLYNLAAILGMLFGIYVVQGFLAGHFKGQKDAIMTILFTALGIVLRVGIMSIVNWTFLRYPPPVGFSIPEQALTAMLPIIGLFNATLALYTIPIGYFLAKAVSSGTKTRMWDQKPRK